MKLRLADSPTHERYWDAWIDVFTNAIAPVEATVEKTEAR
jgi:hypothetical protein